MLSLKLIESTPQEIFSSAEFLPKESVKLSSLGASSDGVYLSLPHETFACDLALSVKSYLEVNGTAELKSPTFIDITFDDFEGFNQFSLEKEFESEKTAEILSVIENQQSEIEKCIKRKRRLGKGAKRRLRVAQKAESPPEEAKNSSAFRLAPFSMKLMCYSNYATSLRDSTNTAENLARLPPALAAHKHMFKRLNFYYAIAQYIHQHASELESCSFDFEEGFKGQFKAVDYVIPKDYEHKPGSGLQRMHISILSKLILKNGNEFNQIEGMLTINKKICNLSYFLNICDMGPELLNDIDCYVEIVGRLSVMTLLEDLKRGFDTPLSSATRFADQYSMHLVSLLDNLEGQFVHIPPKQANYVNDVLDKCSKNMDQTYQYVDGMNKAINAFLEQIRIAEEGGPTSLYQVE